MFSILHFGVGGGGGRFILICFDYHKNLLVFVSIVVSWTGFVFRLSKGTKLLKSSYLHVFLHFITINHVICSE